MAIAVSGQTCRLREILIRDKPEAMLAASPKGTVPVLVLADGHVIEESLEVMQWALKKNDPENWSFPMEQDPHETQTLIAENDGPFKENLDRYKYPNRYDNTDPIEHRTKGLGFLQKLDHRLEAQPYLAGNHFSILDAAIAPFIRQFANTDRDWFNQAGLRNVPEWLDGILGSDRFTCVMQKYPAWKQSGEEIAFPESLPGS